MFFVMIATVSLKFMTFMKVVAIYILIVSMYVRLFLLTFKLQQWLCLEKIKCFSTMYAVRKCHLRKLHLDSYIFYFCVRVSVVFYVKH